MNGRLCILSTSLAGGGAEKVAVNLANDFSRRNLPVDLVLLQSHGPYRDRIASRVNVIDLHARRVRYSIPAVRSYLRHYYPTKLLSVVRDTNLAAALAAVGLTRQPEMYFREANTFDDLDLMPSWKAYLLRLGMNMFYGRARLMIANSEGTRKDILGLGIPGLRVEVIHNPVLPTDFESLVNMQTDHRWFADDSLRVVISAGRLDVQKDFATLVRAFALVHQEMPTARLMILGVGAEQANLQKLITELRLSEVAELVGFVSNPLPYFSKASVFALTSRWEGFGNVIVEALAAATPVVATNCPGGPAEILAGGKYGDLVPVGCHRAIAEAIVRNLENRRDAEQLRSRARDFTADRIGAQYAETMGVE